MARIITVRNPTHPHNQFREFIQKMKAEYRKMSALDLTKTVSVVYSILAKEAAAATPPLPMMPLPTHRHQQIAFMLEFHEVKFKKEWKGRYGWPFEEIYDDAKFAQHQAEGHAKNLGTAKEPLITDKMIEEAREAAEKGGRMEKEQYDHMLTILSVMKAGLAGVTKDGVVVDRRRRGVITSPLPKSEVLGTPEPVEVTPEMKRAFHAELEMKALAEADSLAPTDLAIIRSEEGKIYTREQFDALTPEAQHAIRCYRGHLVQLIAKAGWMGKLPDGKLADRRIHPEAEPLKKGEMFDCPEPKPMSAFPDLAKQCLN